MTEANTCKNNNCGSNWNYGFLIRDSTNNYIINNTCLDGNMYGMMYGMSIINSTWNVFKYNNITNNLFGIEIEKSKAKIASKRGIKIEISNLNNRFSFKDGSMDVVVANHVIEHLIQTELFINEIYRVLKRGGYAVIATPNLASWHNVFALILGLQPFSGPNVRISDHDIKSVSGMDKQKAKKWDQVYVKQ